jgi:BirA family biotin operon repressor/biotin-[acetyl-CoA-carboxylase] ligase
MRDDPLDLGTTERRGGNLGHGDGNCTSGEPVRLELASVGSTQDELRRLAEGGAPAWSTVRADEQTAGRGRRGRGWSTPAGKALAASILLRPARPPEELGGLSLVAGLVVAEALQPVLPDVQVRWPTDVVVHGAKLAGVLAELLGGPAVIVGVGVNLTQGRDELPPTGRLPATSLLLEGVSPVPTPAGLLDDVAGRLREAVSIFERHGLGALVPRLAALDGLAGHRVRLRLADGSATEGAAGGIGDDGSLVLETDRGEERHVAGEVEAVET